MAQRLGGWDSADFGLILNQFRNGGRYDIWLNFRITLFNQCGLDCCFRLGINFPKKPISALVVATAHACGTAAIDCLHDSFALALNLYTLKVYTCKGITMDYARVFQSGNSQAVRLPKEFRFAAKQVEIFRRGDEIVLRERPCNALAIFDALSQLPEDVICERQDDTPQTREEF